MDDALRFAGLVIVPSAAAALAAAWLLGRLLPPAAAARYALATAAATGFFAGYALLPDWAALVPARHWQWLPYLGIAAAALGAVGSASGVQFWERWLLYALLAVVAAWQLVPTWATLEPARPVAIPLLAAYLFLLMALLAALPERLLGKQFVASATAATIGVALLLAIGVSAKFGAVAAVAAAAHSGAWAASRFTAQQSPSPVAPIAAAARGVIPVFVILAGGLAFVGAIEPSPKLYPLFLAPAAPLVLWLFAAGPLARLSGWSAIAAQSTAVLTVLIVALAWVALSGAGDGWGG
jgi:hypothetical protein